MSIATTAGVASSGPGKIGGGAGRVADDYIAEEGESRAGYTYK